MVFAVVFGTWIVSTVFALGARVDNDDDNPGWAAIGWGLSSSGVALNAAIWITGGFGHFWGDVMRGGYIWETIKLTFRYGVTL